MCLAYTTIIYPTKWQVIIKKVNSTVINACASRSCIFDQVIDVFVFSAVDIHGEWPFSFVDSRHHLIQILIYSNREDRAKNLLSH